MDSSKMESTQTTVERQLSPGKTLKGKQTSSSNTTPSKDKREAWMLINNPIEGIKF
jgi:hypothetical protein